MKNTACSIEPLEARIAPAALLVSAVYVAATGELTITSENANAAQHIEVFQTGVDT